MERVPPRLLLPDVPALVAGPRHATWVSPEGEVETLPFAAAARRLTDGPVLVCHAPPLARRLGLGHERFEAFDVLELFAFVCPARFCLPTPRGLAEALEQPAPATPAAEALALALVTEALLRRLGQPRGDERSDPVAVAWALGTVGWRWAAPVLAALGAPGGPANKFAEAGLAVWRRLPEWSVEAPEPVPAQQPVEPAEARRRLAELLHSQRRAGHAEARPQQSDYADALAAAFAPRADAGAPALVLAEAGTGVGKTLGYLAPASLWAEKNRGAVWISTYTRNLQHQIDDELDRLYPDPATKARKVVLRKGRENYLCLLNFEEAVRASGLDPRYRIALGLLARWIAATRDGDLQGSDFPGWLVDVLGRAGTLGLADRRGECIYSGCEHYNRCFIEKSIRRARRADIVIANHALVMIQAAQGGGDDSWLPTRYVFDEGHHVFDAADSAFAAHLTGLETRELRRWLLGADADGRGGGGRARGLKRRLEDLISDSERAAGLLDEALQACRALPADGWRMRLAADNPTGPTERFLYAVRRQVLARSGGRDSPYSLETETSPLGEGVGEAAAALAEALGRLDRPLTELAATLAALIEDESASLESEQRRRIDALARGLARRTEQTVRPWQAMAEALGAPTPAGFVDWFGLERMEGRDVDVGMYRHFVDPTLPLSQIVLSTAHGLAITSATLTDGSGNPERDWAAAELRTGSVHLARPALRVAVPSPFDYPAHTRVLVVNDVRKDDLGQVAAAYRALFLAAKGGALGLFTAISRLRAVHARIAGPLDEAGLPLYAQHVDGLDVATLIDIFRGEDSACLLGTDAVRDGVDVPGRSLHLIVFDRVPWPRPDILHKARREHFGGRGYDDMLTRLRLKQAFGRLIRRADDTGVFVLLDPLMPSRLGGAFPPGVEIQRVGLAEAVRIAREFLGPSDSIAS
ncbi:MAG: helicase C-terminal domain-containing protein [Rhodospirillaceae bacterium]